MLLRSWVWAASEPINKKHCPTLANMYFDIKLSRDWALYANNAPLPYFIQLPTSIEFANKVCNGKDINPTDTTDFIIRNYGLVD